MSVIPLPKSNHHHYMMLSDAYSKALAISRIILNDIDDMVLMYVTGTLPPEDKIQYLAALDKFNIYSRRIKDMLFLMGQYEKTFPEMGAVSTPIFVRFCELMQKEFSGLISYKEPVSEETEIVCSVITVARMLDKHTRKESNRK